MGAYCRVPLPRHAAREGETFEVLWSDYYGAALFGDRDEIACVPHKGCRLEIVAAAATSDHEVDLLVPGQVLRYERSYILLDRLVLPNGKKVSLGHFVGFKLRLAPVVTAAPPSEEMLIRRVREEPRGDGPGRFLGRRAPCGDSWMPSRHHDVTGH